MTALYPQTLRGNYFMVQMGDGAATEVFTNICGLSTRDFDIAVNTNEVYQADCNDPESIPFALTDITGQIATIAGQGRYNRTQAAIIRAAVGVSKHYRFIISQPVGQTVDGGYYAGNFILTGVKFGGKDGERGTADLTWKSDGPYVWVVV